MKLTQEHLDTIRNYGAEAGYVEVGGIITTSGELIYLGNEEPYPNYFEKDAYGNDIIYPCVMDYMLPDRALIWHTHPPQWWCYKISEGDKVSAEFAGVPNMSYHHASDTFDWYVPPSAEGLVDFSILTGGSSNSSVLVSAAPFHLTESHQNKILRFADRYGYNNQEIAGIITPDNEVEMLPNLAADPTNHFQIDWGNEPVAAIWHTHLPHHPAQLSEEDISESDRLGLPYVMFHVGQQAWDFYQPQTQQRQAISTLKFKYVPNKRDLIAEAAKYQKEIQKASATIKKHNDRLQKEWQAANQQALKIISASNSKIDRRLSQISASRVNTNRYQSRAKLLAEEFSRLRD